MPRQRQKSYSWKIVTYHTANWTLAITTWIWSTVILGFLIQFVPSLFLQEDATKILQTGLSAKIVDWLRTPAPASIEPLRVIALSIAAVLLIAPPLAFALKQLLQEIQQEDFDKLIDVLQKDTISPQLERLQKRLEQEIQMQATCLEVLQYIASLLQQAPTSTILEEWQTSSQQQQEAWQKELSQTLQDIQTKNSEQVQQLGNLYSQDQYTQEQVLVSLRNVSFLLEQVLVRPPSSAHRENESSSKLGPITGPVSAAIPPISRDQLSPISEMPIERAHSSSIHINEPTSIAY